MKMKLKQISAEIKVLNDRIAADERKKARTKVANSTRAKPRGRQEVWPGKCLRCIYSACGMPGSSGHKADRYRRTQTWLKRGGPNEALSYYGSA